MGPISLVGEGAVLPSGARDPRRALLTRLSLPQGYLPPTKNGAEPKRPSRPINITPLARLSATVPNTIVVNWSSEFGRVSMAEVGSEGESPSVLRSKSIFLFMGLSLNLLSLFLMARRGGGGVQSRG